GRLAVFVKLKGFLDGMSQCSRLVSQTHTCLGKCVEIDKTEADIDRDQPEGADIDYKEIALLAGFGEYEWILRVLVMDRCGPVIRHLFQRVRISNECLNR